MGRGEEVEQSHAASTLRGSADWEYGCHADGSVSVQWPRIRSAEQLRLFTIMVIVISAVYKTIVMAISLS